MVAKFCMTVILHVRRRALGDGDRAREAAFGFGVNRGQPGSGNGFSRFVSRFDLLRTLL